MPELFRNRYRVPSARAEWWDYADNGAYFITICTRNQGRYFGDIADGKMQLSEVGLIAQREWERTLELRPDMNLTLGEFCIMPNHIHGIVIIGTNQYNTEPTGNKFASQSKNLASIVRGYKIGVTTTARKNNVDFAWQPRFHDRIIRDDDEYQRIANYIRDNPQNWEADEFFP
jgi:REP element-mobilizing transposase RayT